MDIHLKIKELRQGKGFSQNDMADKLGLALISYGKIERGETELSVKRLYEIAEKLEVSVGEILGIQDETASLKGELETKNILLSIEQDKHERLKYDISSFLLIIKDAFLQNKYFKIIKTILPKSSELLDIITETERKIREDY